MCVCVYSNKLCSLHLTLFCHFHFVPQAHTLVEMGMDYCGGRRTNQKLFAARIKRRQNREEEEEPGDWGIGGGGGE